MGEGVELCVHRGGRTGTVVVLVEPGGERTMLTDRGSATDLAGVPESFLDDVAVLHLTCVRAGRRADVHHREGPGRPGARAPGRR